MFSAVDALISRKSVRDAFGENITIGPIWEPSYDREDRTRKLPPDCLRAHQELGVATQKFEASIDAALDELEETGHVSADTYERVVQAEEEYNGAKAFVLLICP